VAGVSRFGRFSDREYDYDRDCDCDYDYDYDYDNDNDNDRTDKMPLGPVMLDLAGAELALEEREMLRHPAVGGVILFARNYEEPQQIARLTAAIRGLRNPPLVIAVDQEGGRVQRFRDGFTRLPPAGRFGLLHRRDPGRARAAARAAGWLMAAELNAVGVDFSFAPVLDLDRGISRVIGDRAFAAGAKPVCDLALAWTEGVHQAGMAAVGKHFPGHGGVAADSHAELPQDPRPLADIAGADLVPFERLIRHGLEAVMPAHVRYPQADPDPAGFSRFWLRRILREELGFQGVVFSDDLDMAAAAAAGDFAERAAAAREAGCDVLLICNNRPGALAVLASLEDPREVEDPNRRWDGLRARAAPDPAGLHQDPRWQEARRILAELEAMDLPATPDTRAWGHAAARRHPGTQVRRVRTGPGLGGGRGLRFALRGLPRARHPGRMPLVCPR